MHTRNLAFTIPSIHSISEEELFQKLGDPEIGLLKRKDGNPLEPGMPEYLVRPTSYPGVLSLSSNPIKIIDFGESFLSNDVPHTLHTPLPVRAPEIIFGDKLDHRVDLWSMGCMVSTDLEDIYIGDEHHFGHNLGGNLHFSAAFRARSRPTAVRQHHDNAHDPCPPNAGDGQ